MKWLHEYKGKEGEPALLLQAEERVAELERQRDALKAALEKIRDKEPEKPIFGDGDDGEYVGRCLADWENAQTDIAARASLNEQGVK